MTTIMNFRNYLKEYWKHSKTAIVIELSVIVVFVLIVGYCTGWR